MLFTTTALLGLAAASAIFVPRLVKKIKEKQAQPKRVRVRRNS